MPGDIQMTVVGNLTDVPDLRYTDGGDAVANFTVASTARIYKDGKFIDGDTTFIRCKAWKELGEAFAELDKGQRVIVTGQFKQQNYERDGQKRSAFELRVEDGGPSYKWGNKPRESGSNQGNPRVDRGSFTQPTSTATQPFSNPIDSNDNEAPF